MAKRQGEEMFRERAAILFKRISQRLDLSPDLPSNCRYICGVDVAYRGEKAWSAAIIYDLCLKRVVESVCVEGFVKAPYIPTLLYLREAAPMVRAISRLLHPIDLLLVDANGILHPYRSGLACLLGIYLDKPTIGVAKKLLCGEVKDVDGVKTILLEGEPVGFMVEKVGSEKRLYISPGHRISLRATLKFFQGILGESPLPIQLAHELASGNVH
jgi:deoxyribonuclease V